MTVAPNLRPKSLKSQAKTTRVSKGIGGIRRAPFSIVFITLSQHSRKSASYGAMDNLHAHIRKFSLRVCSAGKCVPRWEPKRGHILNRWSPRCSRMLSFGGGTPVAPTFSGNEVRTQVTPGTDFPLLAKKYENGLIFSAGAPRRPGTRLLQFWHHEVT